MTIANPIRAFELRKRVPTGPRRESQEVELRGEVGLVVAVLIASPPQAVRTRGSSHVYRMSTMKLAARMPTVIIMNRPCMSG